MTADTELKTKQLIANIAEFPGVLKSRVSDFTTAAVLLSAVVENLEEKIRIKIAVESAEQAIVEAHKMIENVTKTIAEIKTLREKKA